MVRTPEKMNDPERRMWILNNEGLYNWYISSKLPIFRFIKNNREEIDKIIEGSR
jgi:hypothetical protein